MKAGSHSLPISGRFLHRSPFILHTSNSLLIPDHDDDDDDDADDDADDADAYDDDDDAHDDADAADDDDADAGTWWCSDGLTDKTNNISVADTLPSVHRWHYHWGGGGAKMERGGRSLISNSTAKWSNVNWREKWTDNMWTKEVHWFTVHNNVQLEEQTLPLFLLRTSHHRQQLELVREKLVVEHSLFAQLSALCLTSL